MTSDKDKRTERDECSTEPGSDDAVAQSRFPSEIRYLSLEEKRGLLEAIGELLKEVSVGRSPADPRSFWSQIGGWVQDVNPPWSQDGGWHLIFETPEGRVSLPANAFRAERIAVGPSEAEAVNVREVLRRARETE